MKDFYWVTDETEKFIRDYLEKGETIQERVGAIARRAEAINGIGGFADKFYDYMAKGYFSLASPIWSNFGRSGLPISCNNVRVGDNMASILYKQAEVGMQTKHGAGTSAYLGDIRPRGAKINTGGHAFGPVHFAELFESTTQVISQGSVRRGSCAVYLDVDHPDIYEFLEIREPGNSIQNLSVGVCISDAWMTDMLKGDKDKRAVWARIMVKRGETGFPYLFFSDAANRGAPEAYKKHGLEIKSSNLCTEIMLASTEDQSFVCDLSSINLSRWDSLVETDAIQILTIFLDTVMSEYIEKARGIPFMEPAVNFAERQRALGVGVLGWHDLLQSKMLPFESIAARDLNIEIWKIIQERTLEASKSLFEQHGAPSLLEGYDRRNMTLTAVAPTTSSSYILGQTSQSVEPIRDNYHTKNLAKGKFTYRNRYLEAVLDQKGRNTPEVWRSILEKGGSVQHLDFLSQLEKDVFKTFGEIAQIAVITQAADRQEYIDQGQSINVMIHPDTPRKQASELMIAAWELGLKSVYYQRSTSPAQELNRNLLECESCSA